MARGLNLSDQTKRCSKCEEVRSRAEFPINQQRKDGLSSWCRPCARAATRAWESRHPGRALERTNAYRERIGAQAWALRSAEWRRRNPEAAKDVGRAWDRRNPDKRREKGMRRYAEKRRQTLPLSPDQRAEIADFYATAVRLTLETGIEHQVDHIVPLRGKTVCGLHVPWNLDVKTAEANRRKSNTLIGAN